MAWLTGPGGGAATVGFIVLPMLAGAMALWGRRLGSYLASAALLVGAALSLAVSLALHQWANQYGTLVLVLAAAAFFISPAYLEGLAHQHPWPPGRRRAYFLLLGGFVASLMGLGQPWPLVDLWVAVEATTLTSVALVALAPGGGPFEAAWKYVTMAVFGGLVALFGILLLAQPGREPIALGVLLLLVGLGTKAGLVPFHTWLPDAHAEAPAPVSALLSGAELAGVLIVLRRGVDLAAVRLQSPWPHDVLLGLGLVSVAAGVALIPRQANLKRMFAYSSVEHMGVIAVGFGLGGLAALGALLHVFTHGLAKAQAFYLSGGVQARYGTVEVERIGHLHRHLPWTSGGLLVSVAALAGVPPLGPFWSEWLVVLGAFETAGRAWVGIVLAALLAGGFLALAYRTPRLWYQAREPRDIADPTPEPVGFWLPSMALSLLTASAGILVPWLYRGI